MLGWAPGQARGSPQVLRTVPGRTLYSEMSYDPAADAWNVIGRDEATGESSTYTVRHPVEDTARSWRAVHADPGTQATAYVVSEPHQIGDPATQMPAAADFHVDVLRPASALRWQGGQGSARVEAVGGPACADDPTASASECAVIAAQGQCQTDATWCQLCARTCGAAGASCGCVVRDPPVWRPTVIGLDLQWRAPAARRG